MTAHPLPYNKFLERLKAGELPGLKCLDCQGSIIPPNAVCPECGSSKLTARSLSKKGTLKTFTIIRVGPTGYQVPYIVALAELADGAWIMGNVVDVPAEEADMTLIGKKVSVGYRLLDNKKGEGPDEGFAFTFALER